MSNNRCLNCEKELTDKFCAACGQKADTHRISFKNFIFHDIMHGIFHIDKGMLFTARQSLTRPGKAALDYIAGKRKRYYNVFYLILIVAGIIFFVRHNQDNLHLKLGHKVEPIEYKNETSKAMDELFSQKAKIIILLFVPLAALNSFILFKRKKLNIVEHSIIAGMILLGMLIISLAGNLFFYIDLVLPFSDGFSSAASLLTTITIMAIIAFGYYDAFGGDYSKPGISYRLLLFLLMLSFECITLFIIIFGILSNWKFGYINFQL